MRKSSEMNVRSITKQGGEAVESHHVVDDGAADKEEHELVMEPG